MKTSGVDQDLIVRPRSNSYGQNLDDLFEKYINFVTNTGVKNSVSCVRNGDTVKVQGTQE